MVSSIGPEKVGGILFFHAFRDVMWSLVSVAKGNNLHGRHGMYVRMLPKPSRNSATVRKKFQMMTCRNWMENFVVLMYDRSSAASCVNEARLDLFARKQRTYGAIPPTRAALREHAKRAAYQGEVIWGQATASNPETSSLLTGVGFKVKRRGK